MKRGVAWIALHIFILVVTFPAHAQDADPTPFAWTEAGLSLLIPAVWTPTITPDPPEVAFTDGDARAIFALQPETTRDEAFYDLVYAAVVRAGLPPITWTRETRYGRFAGVIGADAGVGWIVRLPDERVLIAVGTPRAAVESALDSLMMGTTRPPDATMLIADVPVYGAITAEQPEQTWSYDGRAGEVITLSAIDPTRANAYDLRLDMEIVIYAPDERELASNDDHGGADLSGVYDAQIRDLFLPAAGRYRIVVRSVQNTVGTYLLGISGARTFALDSTGVARLSGRIQSIFPRERWQFEARAGQIVTITMQTDSGTLDPILELYSPSGRQTAYNDDAADPALGVNAQIVRAELPRDGLYSIDATRYSGTGAYTITIIVS